MAELHFLRPLWLWALVPALLIWIGLWRRQDTVANWRRVIDAHLLEHLLVGQEEGRRSVRPIHLTLVVWVIAAIALAGPSWEREPSPFADDQAGLVVLMKASETMEAEDVQPSRLERAKHKLSDLLERREGAATGLIVYSGSAHLVMPLTRDGRIISSMASELSADLMPESGDSLAEALALAANLLDRAGVPGSVLVITDAVAPSQVNLVADAAAGLPVQFLSVRPVNAPVDPGLQEAARALGGGVVPLTIDQEDVEALADRADSDFRATTTSDGGERWRDAGYHLLPLLALIGLFWSRKGWVVS